MKQPIPGQRIDRSAAVWVRRPDNRGRRQTSRTKRIPWAPAARRRWIFEVLLPDNLGGRNIDSINIVGNARHNRNLLGSTRRIYFVDNDRREKRVHFNRLIVELNFPDNL